MVHTMFRGSATGDRGRGRRVPLLAVVALVAPLLAPVAGAVPTAPTVERVAAATADAAEASTDADAASLARTFDHDVVVSSRTTATEITTALPDGTMQYVASTEPQRVERNGSWIDVDTTMSRTADGSIEPAVATVPVRFSGGGDRKLAQIQTATGAWLSMNWEHGVLPSPVLDGSTALYRDVFPEVDLRVTSTNVGMSQVLIVKTPEAATNPELDTVRFEFDGGEVSREADGGLSAEIDGTDSALVASAPTWWDSSSVDGGSRPTGDAPESSTVPTSTTGDTLSLDVDSVLATPGLDFPVFIDPDFSGTRAHSWWVASNLPNASFLDGQGNDGRGQSVGSVDDPAGDIRSARSFFLMPTEGIKGADIISASFSAHEIWSWNCTATPVELWWTGSMREGATWNESGGGNWIQKLDTVVASGRRGAADCPEKNVGWNASEGAKVAAGSNADSITFGLRAPDEAAHSQWKRFDPSASLTVTYDRRPDSPTNVAMSTPDRGCGVASDPAWVTNRTALVLRATMHDPDGDPMYGRFQVVTASNGGTGHDAPPDAGRVVFATTPIEPDGWDRTMTIDAGTLADGRYAWSARADDVRLQSDDSPVVLLHRPQQRPLDPSDDHERRRPRGVHRGPAVHRPLRGTGRGRGGQVPLPLGPLRRGAGRLQPEDRGRRAARLREQQRGDPRRLPGRLRPVGDGHGHADRRGLDARRHERRQSRQLGGRRQRRRHPIHRRTAQDRRLRRPDDPHPSADPRLGRPAPA
ncbi:hypothetical protein EDF22_3758 [Rathayibacter sp. PhB127]|uniref:hypothetical protein n=1 Tax=Rathayibacter sp. PhB127 TaxID=2485176 RepID=UPI000FB74017|nr:hypothetical protein [Rathayibacter sp. PhB127]ROS21501.1 hypothetical protein EDF22_3758 [Rathayibacter sp. PhB127]